MNAFAKMSGGSSALINAEMSLVQLKAQLATLELQSNDIYLSIYKTIYENAQSEYQKALTQTNEMKKGWIAEEKGLVSEVNITVGETVEVQTAVDGKNIDISSIILPFPRGLMFQR